MNFFFNFCKVFISKWQCNILKLKSAKQKVTVPLLSELEKLMQYHGTCINFFFSNSARHFCGWSTSLFIYVRKQHMSCTDEDYRTR